ncbi:uncharacterized protein LOC135699262 [Ochlerotatus camptorhynchus]|uniref:uncharacterized protein LOC135699262 n=1 Tax=Ochlerotatus camptorhynchus TaxID=644619 RepID=UPI0031CF8949
MFLIDADLIPADLLELTHNQEQHQSIFVSDDGIVYINPSTNDSGAINAPGNMISRDEFKLEIESVKSEMAKLKTEMEQMKYDIIDSINTGVRQAVEDCFEKNLPRFVTMLDMTNRVEGPTPHVQEGKSVEEHNLINDEKDVMNFNKLLANVDVFNDYVKYFSKIIAPDTYSERGDSACYLIVDCLFTRAFWNNFTWTGINRGNKSKRGFREFANVLQLLLKIVRVGDPFYTIKKLESFCKDKLFRYSKARSTSKQLRKPTCRQKRDKKANDDENEAEDVNGKDDDEDSVQTDNATTDSNEDGSDDVEDKPEPAETSMSTAEDESQEFAGFADV